MTRYAQVMRMARWQGVDRVVVFTPRAEVKLQAMVHWPIYPRGLEWRIGLMGAK